MPDGTAVFALTRICVSHDTRAIFLHVMGRRAAMAIADHPGLASYLARKLGAADLRIRGEWQNTEGWSMETFSLALDYAKDGSRTEEEIILRRQPVSGLLEPYDATTEYRILSALQGAGVAIPRTYWCETDPAVFERPFYVMEKVDGRVHFLIQHTDPDYRLIPDDGERARLAEDFIANLVGIHKADWRSLGLDFLGDPGPGRGSALRQIEYWERVIERAGYRNKPLVTLAVNWLKNNAPENDTVRIVHGDYRTGNFIYRDKRIRAILDWEMTHLGDPHEDLVYVMGMLWRSPQPTNWVCHLLPEKEFLERYEALSGVRVEKRKLAYYAVLLDLKAIGIITTAAHSFASYRSPDLRPGVFGTLLDLSVALLAQHLWERLKA
ncbi:MAG: phosphotransferase family protein [bacterium]